MKENKVKCFCIDLRLFSGWPRGRGSDELKCLKNQTVGNYE
jgi:hypothetical protein